MCAAARARVRNTPEVSPRHWRNTQPWQHTHRCAIQLDARRRARARAAAHQRCAAPLDVRRARARRRTSNGTHPGRVQGRGVGKLAQKWCGPASNKAGPLGNRSKLARLRTKQGPCIENQQCPPPLHVHVTVVFQRLVTSWLMPGCAASPAGFTVDGSAPPLVNRLARAAYSSDVWLSLLVHMLTRLCIPPMSRCHPW